MKLDRRELRSFHIGDGYAAERHPASPARLGPLRKWSYGRSSTPTRTRTPAPAALVRTFQRRRCVSLPHVSPSFLSCILRSSSLSLGFLLHVSLSLSLFSFKITVLVRTRSEMRFTVAARRDVFRAVDCSVPCKLSRELTPARLLCARHMMRDVNRTIMCLSYVQSARFVPSNITLLHAVLYSRNALSLVYYSK